MQLMQNQHAGYQQSKQTNQQYNANASNSDNDSQDDGDEDDDSNDNQDEGRRGRRSKHDNDGRVHKCAYCVKTYLSYPALYTHQKQKHSRGPGGELRAPPTSGRGRGRPRKNVSLQIATNFDSALPKDGSKK